MCGAVADQLRHVLHRSALSSSVYVSGTRKRLVGVGGE